MAVTVLMYPPGAGGNHLKNILCLSDRFVNRTDLDLGVYTANVEPPGTAHSVPGRNVHAVFVDKISADTQNEYILHGHFGELAPYREQINSINERRFLVLTINNERDQILLNDRQQRLGQTRYNHPYWLAEEQPRLYDRVMCQSYFNCDQVLEIALYDFWYPELAADLVSRLGHFIGSPINQNIAQDIHRRWWMSNFNFEWSNLVRSMYGRA